MNSTKSEFAQGIASRSTIQDEHFYIVKRGLSAPCSSRISLKCVEPGHYLVHIELPVNAREMS